LDHTFYAAPDSVHMQASATDPDEPADSLDYHWDVFLHHNTHIHYNLSLDGAAGAFVSEDHDDGSGVYYEIRMIVTDSGGLKDTTSVAIYPEADLEPSPIQTNAGHLGPSQP